MADFYPVFLGLPQMAKGNSQMERENSEDRRHIKAFILFAYRSFCHTENREEAAVLCNELRRSFGGD